MRLISNKSKHILLSNKKYLLSLVVFLLLIILLIGRLAINENGSISDYIGGYRTNIDKSLFPGL